MAERLQIRGGAGPYEAAAIAAVIVEHEEQERRRGVQAPVSNLLPPWVLVVRPVPPFGSLPPARTDPGRYWR